MSRPDGAELKRVNSYQWPAGHVGHLSEGQQGALEKFKALCQQKGYYEAGTDKTPASHDDETMLRYLRARKFVPQDAFGQFKDTEDWRRENQLDLLYETIDVEEYEQTRRLYPQWTGRTDKRGIPLYVFEVANLSAKDINAYQNDEDRKKEKKAKKGADGMDIKAKAPRKMLRLFALYENLCRFVLPLCSAVPERQATETPVSQSANIVDLSKVGLKQFWTLRSHLQDSSALATAHYPETLDRIFVIGAPSFFNTIWDWAKGWFDPITVSKIFVLNDKNMLAELSKVVDVENIPQKYGGKLAWSFGDMPFLGPSLTGSLRWKEVTEEHGHQTLPKGPIKWEYDQDGDLVAIAIGTEAGQPRKRVLAGLHPDDGVAKLALSPGRQPLNRANSAMFATLSRHSTRLEQHPHHEKPPNGSASTDVNETSHAAAAATTNSNVMSTNNVNPQTTEESSLPTASPQTVPEEPVSLTANHQTSLEVSVPPPTSLNTSSVENTSTPYGLPHRAQDHGDTRQGTSHTKQVQQTNTHAEGQLASGTPHTRIDGQGTEHSVMEPRTIGQAPKDTPLTREADDPAPTVVEQVQDYAGQAQTAVVAAVGSAVNTVAGAVGLGGGEQEAQNQVANGAEVTSGRYDQQIEQMDQAQMEEFLRAKSSSLPEKLNGKKMQVSL